MKQLQFPIFAASFMLILYLVSIVMNVLFTIVFSLFLLTNILTVWMVIRVLKDGTPSSHTFDERWYEDHIR